MNRIVLFVLIATTAILPGSPSFGVPRQAREVTLSPEELKSTDRFEGHTLAKADQTFSKKQYRQARAEYDSFIIEFSRSKLIPYALLRKGRSSQLDEKRFEAISDYKEILDYFSNDTKYAAAALYHIGECHQLNGDTAKAMKAWAKLADDKEYRKESLGAVAINSLADHLVQRDKALQAAKYYRQIAIDFRKLNPAASRHAMLGVIHCYVRTNPNEAEYRKFYVEMGRFGGHPKIVSGDLTEETQYWDTLRSYIRNVTFVHILRTSGHGVMPLAEEKNRKSHYAYWASQMQGKFANDVKYGDDFHIERARHHFTASQNKTEWFKLLDQRYEQLQKPASWQRTVRWIAAYAGHPKKVEQYFRKLNLAKLEKEGFSATMKALWKTPDSRPLARKLIDSVPFAKMTNDELAAAALHFHEKDQKLTARFISKINFTKMSANDIANLAYRFSQRDKFIGRSVLGKMRWNEVDDKDIVRFARLFWRYDRDLVKQASMRTKNKMVGYSHLVEYYLSRWGRNPAAGLPLADQLVRVEDHAAAAWWAKGEFHRALKQYDKAIAAYRNCQNAPTNLWWISECQMHLKKVDLAVTQMREIENFFPPEASKASLRIAHLYQRASNEKKYLQALRNVLKKYPKSTQSRQAHQELEASGVKTGGSIDAE